MILSPDQTERGARLLYESSNNHGKWSEASAPLQQGYRVVVTELAGKLDVPATPAAVMVFMAWMGNDGMENLERLFA